MTSRASHMYSCATAKQATLPQLDGIFVLDKPSGPSSAQCIAKIKRLGQKKIGHAGTLDPMAGGVLLVLLGHATKISSYLLEGGIKIYNGLVRLGVETDTWDAEGDVVAERDWRNIDPQQVRDEVASWQEMAVQTVPPYSAAKHQGQSLYKLARAGKTVPQKTKEIEIFKTDILSLDMPWIRFRVVCGSGVYIRSLAHSLGKRLGCGAALFELTREHSHPFGLDVAHSLEDVLARPALLGECLQSIHKALPHWPQVKLDSARARRVRNGNPVLAGDCFSEGATALLCDQGGRELALARLDQTGQGKVWTVMRGLWN